MTGIVDRLPELLATDGDRQYGEEAVSQGGQALPCAASAADAEAPATVLAAALLHDISHPLHRMGDRPALRGIDDQHQKLGAELLLHDFGPAVAEPARLHVDANNLRVRDRDCCCRSPASMRSLGLQGGLFGPVEAAAFRALPSADDTIRVRLRDDTAKIAGRRTPPLEHLRPALEAALTTQE